jgi:tetratricopeptide (TPR) repeat protein
MALLAVLGLLEVRRQMGAAPIVRGVIGAALIFSIGVVWLLAVALATFYRGAESAVTSATGGKLDEAAAQYERLCRINPDFKGQAELSIGTAMLSGGRQAEAIGYLNAATRDDPSLAPAHFNLGQAYLQKGRFAEAAAAFGRAAALDPYDGVAEEEEGVALFKEGRLDEAIGHEKAAARIQPSLDVARKDLQEFEAAKKSPGNH